MSVSTLRLTAPLRHDARHFTDTAGGAWMSIELQLLSGSALAVRCMGHGPAAQHAAASESRRYRKGARCIVYATGFMTLTQIPAAIQLTGVDHVELADRPRDFITPEREDAAS